VEPSSAWWPSRQVQLAFGLADLGQLLSAVIPIVVVAAGREYGDREDTRG
jgi:hypothetical protein